MNKVYLDKNGKLFVNGHEIKGVMSVSSETDYLGTQIVLKFEGDYKCDFNSFRMSPTSSILKSKIYGSRCSKLFLNCFDLSNE